MRRGPLAGVRVVEFSGLGPAPLAGQLLADLGAEVVAVDRAAGPADPTDVNRRGKRSVALNLKRASGLAAARRLIAASDILIEGFRPGVMERLGLGPGDCPEALIYGRMTGWGQEGPLAQRAGHDINYLALTGALQAMGPADRPPAPPLNLVADFGGGTMFLLLGLLAALVERATSGKGQVVDAAMSDGVPAMTGLIHGMIARGFWTDRREENWLDGAAPFYRTYACADGRYIAVGALEPQFFAELVRGAGLPETELATQNDRETWPEKRARYAALFATKTRDEWAVIFEKTDACVAPVLDWSEAPKHPQNAERQTFREIGGVTQASPAPRFSRSVPDDPTPPGAPGGDTEAVLGDLGYSGEDIARMRAAGALS
ncbi:CaiB/BaiF CoA-transferase family protein [Sulfitobacter sp. D35]|uniref:CaiB/BaiF CoA transferase family protein n=1 Tax=Sulfitobacter sp. D35 TaxID=3083252 RepID=UPI00296F3E5A|nr:CaiB/BaiF CoA-transferase family protein [Sulfitobacter sp. D35]MDW4499286.1 CaiB/BaiF CoA-transferase family protein [Sulfitobacter sp. D35]